MKKVTLMALVAIFSLSFSLSAQESTTNKNRTASVCLLK